MKIALFSLRSEYRISGEYNSTQAIKRILGELGHEVQDFTTDSGASLQQPLRLDNVMNLSAIRTISKGLSVDDYDIVLVKVPTAAQIPLLGLVPEPYRNRLTVLLDSVAYNCINRGSFSRELYHEPVLAIAKRVLNNPVWTKFSTFRPYAVIGCSRIQVLQAKGMLGDKPRYHYIANTSTGDAITGQQKNDRRQGLVIGYIGHPFAHKGCLELIESRKLLRHPDKYIFKAAFSPSGRMSVRNFWSNHGGLDVGLVTPELFFKTIDILCIPLYAEYGTKVFPNVILEVMKSGMPVLTTRLPTVMELLGRKPPFPLLDKVNACNIAHALEVLADTDMNMVSDYLRKRYELFSYDSIKAKWKITLEQLNGK